MTEETIEQEIQRKGLTAPRVTPAQIDATIAHVQYHVFPGTTTTVACNGISVSPYECSPCDWKVYGLFRDLGKGVYVFVKEHVRGELLFMPLAWEKQS